MSVPLNQKYLSWIFSNQIFRFGNVCIFFVRCGKNELCDGPFRAWTASSRLFYALARDNALPFKSSFMSLTGGQAPWLGVWISVLVGSIICCAYIGSPVACMCFQIYYSWLKVEILIFRQLMPFSPVRDYALVIQRNKHPHRCCYFCHALLWHANHGPCYLA
jgi:amino acid transporter